MKRRSDKLKPSEIKTENEKETNLLGYQIYHDSKDIYINFQEEEP